MSDQFPDDSPILYSSSQFQSQNSTRRKRDSGGYMGSSQVKAGYDLKASKARFIVQSDGDPTFTIPFVPQASQYDLHFNSSSQHLQPQSSSISTLPALNRKKSFLNSFDPSTITPSTTKPVHTALSISPKTDNIALPVLAAVTPEKRGGFFSILRSKSISAPSPSLSRALIAPPVPIFPPKFAIQRGFEQSSSENEVLKISKSKKEEEDLEMSEEEFEKPKRSNNKLNSFFGVEVATLSRKKSFLQPSELNSSTSSAESNSPIEVASFPCTANSILPLTTYFSEMEVKAAISTSYLATKFRSRFIRLSITNSSAALHSFKTSALSEIEVVRFELTESTVAFVAEGEGKKNLLKVTGNMLVNEHGVVSKISTYVLLGFDDVAVMSDWLGIFKSTVTNLRLIGSPNQKSNRHSQQSFTFTNVNGGSGGSEADTERSSRPLSSDSYSSLMSSNQLPDTPPSSSLFGSFPTPPSLVPTPPSNYQIQNKRTKRGPPSLSPPNFPLPPLPFVGFTDSNASLLSSQSIGR